jgi:hypothetical protein
MAIPVPWWYQEADLPANFNLAGLDEYLHFDRVPNQHPYPSFDVMNAVYAFTDRVELGHNMVCRMEPHYKPIMTITQTTSSTTTTTTTTSPTMMYVTGNSFWKTPLPPLPY